MPLIRSASLRLLGALISIVGVVWLVFLAVRVAPGDPVDVLLGERATAVERATLRRQMHLDGDLWQQAGGWIAELADGDLGTSITARGRPVAVSTLLAEAAPPTVRLATAAIAVGLLLSLLLGTWAALDRSGAGDLVGRAWAVVATSTPIFVTGPLALLIGAVALPWLPSPAHPDAGGDSAAGLWLPALVLGAALSGRMSRLLRTRLRHELGQGPARALLLRGLSPTRTVVAHLWPNALLPLLPALAHQLGGLLGGALVCEAVFGRPGVGTLLVEAVFARDPALVQGVTIALAAGYAALLATVDMAVALLDPRTRATTLEAT